MSATKPYLSFQAKVLVPVIVLMVLLVVVTMWVVNRRMTGQMQREAQLTLLRADNVFKNSLEIHRYNLLLRYSLAANTRSTFYAVVQLDDEPTMHATLEDFLKESGSDTEAILFSPTFSTRP